MFPAILFIEQAYGIVPRRLAYIVILWNKDLFGKDLR